MEYTCANTVGSLMLVALIEGYSLVDGLFMS